VTSARRDDVDEKLLRRRADPVSSLVPPLNAANDNERDVRLASEDWGSITTAQSSTRTSSEKIVLAAVCTVTVAILALGWIFVISLTLLDGVNWALSFFGK
jgi:hypothetical protein